MICKKVEKQRNSQDSSQTKAHPRVSTNAAVSFSRPVVLLMKSPASEEVVESRIIEMGFSAIKMSLGAH